MPLIIFAVICSYCCLYYKQIQQKETVLLLCLKVYAGVLLVSLRFAAPALHEALMTNPSGVAGTRGGRPTHCSSTWGLSAAPRRHHAHTRQQISHDRRVQNI